LAAASVIDELKEVKAAQVKRSDEERTFVKCESAPVEAVEVLLKVRVPPRLNSGGGVVRVGETVAELNGSVFFESVGEREDVRVVEARGPKVVHVPLR
jgi:hypothetical protein